MTSWRRQHRYGFLEATAAEMISWSGPDESLNAEERHGRRLGTG